MQTKPYTKRKIDNSERVNASIGKSIVVDSASSLYMLLKESCADDMTEEERYAILKQVFRRAVDQAVLDCQIAFVGLFAKVDYCIKEYDIPSNIANLIQLGRKDLFPRPNSDQELSAEELSKLFPHNLKATTLLVYHVCGKEEIPEQLKACFPRADRKKTWGRYSEKVLRVVVERWDDEYIWATEEENNNTMQISYGNHNHILTLEGKSDWSYLKTTLWEGARLNLVRIRMDERGEICLPELIILEPDYLINITTISSCFESYAESPFVNLVNKIKPNPNTLPIHLGNLSGQFLDDVVHDRNIAFSDSIKEFVSRNIMSIISCPGMELPKDRIRFTQDAQIQKRNISHLIGVSLPQSIKDYNRKGVVLEPSFFSEVLGIQGRLDLLHEKNGNVTIIEQKSGKGAFVPFTADGFNPNRPEPQEKHLVQLSLYRALFNYEFGKRADQLRHFMLLYSKYSEGLVSIASMPELTLRAIRMRNLLAWLHIDCANNGFGILRSLTPDMLNRNMLSGRLWDEWVRPELERTLNPIRMATPLELAYYLRFMRFVGKEHLLSKIGNKTKDDSGFAAVWLDTLEDKRAAGNIYEGLTIASFGENGDAVESLQLKFSEARSVDTSNFRTGDIVIVYPYSLGCVPNACAQMVNRASISDITEEGVEVVLRNSQTDRRVFDLSEDVRWAIEHDMFESSVKSLYSGIHSFLSASKERRDLLLCQREPTIDESQKLCGDYGSFNTLVARAKQARDIFLVIGPPGTGKTSFGLLNILKEELTNPAANVVLLSYTNRAVDEICSKLVESGIDFLRIGSELNCDKAFSDHLLCNRAKDCRNARAVSELIANTRVFCATTSALNANIHLLKIKHFDLAIIDESSQILEPHLIGLLAAHTSTTQNSQLKIQNSIGRFVLIGDHKQLPAVVQQTAEESRVDEPELHAINLTDCRLSLFERLLKWFKTAEGYDPRFVYMLTHQGRMHQEIAEFPNIEFYGGKLSVVPLPHQTLPTGTDVTVSTPHSTLHTPHSTLNTPNGIVRMLNAHRIAFIASPHVDNTTAMKTNQAEAEMIAATVMQIYRSTADRFDEAQTVGIIVPYRNQIATIRSAIDAAYRTMYGDADTQQAEAQRNKLHNITIDTVERYQGSQRDYIIYGFTVRQRYQLDFLTNNTFEEDAMRIDRKLNVAMTRARLHMLMVGNPEVLRQDETFSRLIDFAKHSGAYYDIPVDKYCAGDFPVNTGN